MGTVWVPVDFARAWEYDYACGHRADAINGLGNIRMLSRAGPYRDKNLIVSKDNFRKSIYENLRVG